MQPGSLGQALSAAAAATAISLPDLSSQSRGGGGGAEGTTGAWLKSGINSWPCFYGLVDKLLLHRPPFLPPCKSMSHITPTNAPMVQRGGWGGAPCQNLAEAEREGPCRRGEFHLWCGVGAGAAGKEGEVKAGGTLSPANLSFSSPLAISLSLSLLICFTLCSLHLLPSLPVQHVESITGSLGVECMC